MWASMKFLPKLEHLWRINGEKESLLLPGLSLVISFLFLL